MFTGTFLQETIDALLLRRFSGGEVPELRRVPREFGSGCVGQRLDITLISERRSVTDVTLSLFKTLNRLPKWVLALRVQVNTDRPKARI
jgi:hypothetical protein